MLKDFLTDESIKGFVESLKIDQAIKSSLESKISQLDEEERIGLFNVLKEVYFLDLEEDKSIDKIRKYWRR